MSTPNSVEAWAAIRKINSWLPVSSDGWHQHPNGGGWVNDDAKVADNAFVGTFALILGGTIEGGTIWGGTILGGTILGGTILGGTIEGGTILGGTIEGGTIEGGTILGGTIEGGTIKGGTIKGGTIRGGTIKGGTITRSPICIFGSHYSICCSAPGLITSGCITKPITWWLENVERCAEEHGYSVDEQREYRMHIEHIAAWMKLYGWEQASVNDMNCLAISANEEKSE